MSPTTTITPDPGGEPGLDFLVSMDPDDGAAWLTVGRVSLLITLSDEGSVQVQAFRHRDEMADPLDELYVSWLDLPEPGPVAA